MSLWLPFGGLFEFEMKRLKTNVLIVGGGVSGIISGILCSEKKEVLLLEKPARDFKLGKRILVSGNGRANFFNEDLLTGNIEEKYQFLLSDGIASSFLSFLKRNGFAYEKEGKLFYPYFKRSECLHSFLLSLMKDVKIKCALATSVDRKNKIVYAKGEEGDLAISYQDLILSIGGRSFDREDYSYSILDSLNVNYKPYQPMLCPVRVKEKIPSYLNKQRLRGTLSLYHQKKLLYAEEGEILFKEDGISGICVFNSTKYLLDEMEKSKEKKDYFYLFSYSEKEGIDENTSLSCYPSFLVRYLKESHYQPLQKLKFTFSSLYPFRESQASYGGIELFEIDEKTLHLIKDEHIYVIGEMCDVNLPCGGYNMGVALLSGFRVGKEIEEK